MFHCFFDLVGIVGKKGGCFRDMLRLSSPAGGYSTEWTLISSNYISVYTEFLQCLGQSSVGRVIAWYTGSPGFNPQHCIVKHAFISSTRKTDTRRLEFKIMLGYIMHWRPSWINEPLSKKRRNIPTTQLKRTQKAWTEGHQNSSVGKDTCKPHDLSLITKIHIVSRVKSP